VGDTGDGVSVADGQDRGEAGLGGSDRGVREEDRERQGAELKRFKTFSNRFKIWSIRKVLSLA
jgi:hypothetical protein